VIDEREICKSAKAKTKKRGKEISFRGIKKVVTVNKQEGMGPRRQVTKSKYGDSPWDG
jgi:hypothetical protein